jgi:hypothetical protein
VSPVNKVTGIGTEAIRKTINVGRCWETISEKTFGTGEKHWNGET